MLDDVLVVSHPGSEWEVSCCGRSSPPPLLQSWVVGSGFRSRQEPGPDSLVRGFLRRMCHCAMRELTDRKRGSTDLGLAIEICDNNKIEREAWVGNR